MPRARRAWGAFVALLVFAGSAAAQSPTVVPALPEPFPLSELESPDFAPPELVAPPAAGCSLWLVSSRAVDCNAPPEQLQYAIGDGCGRWVASSYEELRSTDQPDVPTLIYVHGNRYDAEDAVIVGQAVFSRLAREVAPHPLRVIIWSWPSERIVHSLRKDVRVKAVRGEEEGRIVANFAATLDPRTPVCLVGHSYGARVICPALHWLDVADEERQGAKPRRRAVFMAGGLDCHWLAPDGKYGRAFEAVERAVVLFNPCDSILKWYPRLWGRNGPEAQGLVGLPTSAFAVWGQRVEQIDVEPLLGRRHSFYDYFQTPPIWHVLADEVLFDWRPVPATAAAVTSR